MAEISVQVEAFREAASAFKGAAIFCENNENRVKTDTQELLSNWEGKSKDAFESEYEFISGSMENYKDVILSISDELESIAKSFEEADAEIQRSVG